MFPQVHMQYALFLCHSSSAMVCLQWSQPLGSYNNKSIYFLEWTPIESHLCLTWVGAPDHTPLTYEIVLSYLHFNTFTYLLVPSSSNNTFFRHIWVFRYKIKVSIDQVKPRVKTRLFNLIPPFFFVDQNNLSSRIT